MVMPRTSVSGDCTRARMAWVLVPPGPEQSSSIIILRFSWAAKGDAAATTAKIRSAKRTHFEKVVSGRAFFRGRFDSEMPRKRLVESSRLEMSLPANLEPSQVSARREADARCAQFPNA